MNRRFASGDQRYVEGVGLLNTGSISPIHSLRPLKSLIHSRAVSAIAFNGDGSLLVSGSEDHMLRIWNPHSGEMVLGPLSGHADFVRSVCWHGQTVASASDDTTLRLWCASSGKCLALLSGHQVKMTDQSR